MKKRASIYCALGVITCVLAVVIAMAPRTRAANPGSGTVSAGTPVNWTGGPFATANPVTCFSVAGIDPTCDRFSLTVVAPKADFVLRVRVTAANATDTAPPTDDIDLFVQNSNGETIASSGTPGGVEEVVIYNPPAGTYTVIVQPFVVVPAISTYSGVASIGEPADGDSPRAYHGALFTETSVGVPQSRPAKASGQKLEVSFRYVGRGAAEPTVAINRNNTAFYAAATFDFPTPSAPRRLARTVVMRSKDKGETWQAVSPPFPLSNEVDLPGEPPFTLDPMIIVDNDFNPDARKGRVFSVDLNAACGANSIYSDDEGVTWQRRPLLGCSTPINDHHTIVAGRPSPPGAPGLTTTNGYPNLLYFFFNRVVDSSGGRSNDGGDTFVHAGTAFTGTDPNAGSLCGGLTGHLAADSKGRIFLPKGHCGLPWVARSDDGGSTWNRARIAGHTRMADHEVSLAVDSADNIYAVWQDGTFRLPFLSISRDNGATWSTPRMIAPPGVREVNFPTIVAGDAGRIAVLFPGSESLDWDDATRPWNIYVVVSVNALDSDPTFAWTIANPKNDPVHRGACGPGRCDAEDGGSMFDFLDIQVSPSDGMVWGTASDTCVGACVTDPQAQKLRPGAGVAIRQLKGPRLLKR